MLLLKERANQTRNLVLITGIVSTLSLWTSLYDPINLPKMFVLAIFSAWIMGTLATTIVSERSVKVPIGIWGIVTFMAGIFITAIHTDVHFTAFFGTLQRNDGAVTYLSLAALSLAAMMSFNVDGLGRLKISLISIGAILTFHGLLQVTGHDPFKWILLYSPVVGTVGNPDFMSAILSICALASVWVLLSETSLRLRIATGILAVLEIFVIKKTGSVQGLMAFAIGIAVLLLVKSWQLNRRLGHIFTASLVLVSIPGFLGIINKGPLASLLFRSSVKNRLDYWHAALGMFKAHPLFGVGLDRFGENYGLYAPQIQVVQGQITNNAHNVFLQILATGGLLLFLPYIFLLGVIFHSAFKAFRVSKGVAQLNLVGIFVIWFSLLLISFISIDNIGVTVWFWICGGVLYAVSTELQLNQVIKMTHKGEARKKSVLERSRSSTAMAPVVSLVLTVSIMILLLPSLKASAAIMELQGNKDGLTPALYIHKMNDAAGAWPRNPQTMYLLSDLGLRIQRPDLALKFAQQNIAMDPKSNFGRQLGATALEAQKNFASAIRYRLELLKLDPWNTLNMVNLVRDYLAVNDRPNANSISKKISRLYPNSSDAVTAATLIKE